MKSKSKQFYLFSLLGYFLVLLSTSGCTSADSAVEQNLSDSTNVKGVVYIASPKVGTLLQLRGIAGKGLLIVRQQNTERCMASPIKLAAGDFGGTSIAINTNTPIRLLIYSDEVVSKLRAGDEVVSESYKVTDQSEASLGDIKIKSGLTLSYGFVLNPGEWSWASFFGNEDKTVHCEEEMWSDKNRS
ncbi:hypothetical protein SAMN02745127_00096 [Oceanospirillum multiglobuliferum]|uniref:Ysc84 actin-binding domain-containing protein n=1 Tax=Oceanospirillum multiglobuliferum TaxID=64969 RepID=A0A1T4KJB9_9GAMM|nr:hypothetical protein [Oceanospirillum multiglobuliferum]OPX56047.1 hypothetical protein BTE48_05680 [Oceanospirillum multiglobuliferum]SJZ42477.1 hypothetical protein SAMN02745127_00096 [Oceanospirillum multiglobuliferum]